ncbi:MAG: hypothetical protein DHS20C15_12220 [Planctomycetota bacterium]|nr:MAG: hypothetical protein DHS20C15_12220 [Planctomycetota bacterium]
MFRLPLLSVALILFALPQPSTAGDPVGDPVRIFEVSGSGKTQHIHGNGLGDKTFVTKINKKSIVSCVTGVDFGDCQLIPNTKDGKVYLYIYDSGNWGIALDPDPSEATVTFMEGLTDGKGKFMFIGSDPTTGVQYIAEGKAKLDKALGDDLIPTKVSGKLRAIDVAGGHTAVSSFKSVGKALEIEL